MVSTLATLTDSTEVINAAYALYVTTAKNRHTISNTLPDGFEGVQVPP